MDYKNLDRTIQLHAYMIPPTNLDDTYGELFGVDWSSLSLTAGYYTDTRVSGSLSLVGSNWIRGSFIRIVVEIPEYGFVRELATFAVSDDDAEYKNGVWNADLTLVSMLHTMSLDLGPCPRVINAGASFLGAFRSECKAAGRQYNDGGAVDAKASSVSVMETGSSRLSRCYDISGITGNRLDVDGHGRVTLSQYFEPWTKTPVLTLDIQDNNGVVFDGIKRSNNWASIPSVAVVSYKYSEQVGKKTVEKEIVASTSVEATSHGSLTQRGYNVTDFQELSEMAPATYKNALAIATKNLQAKQTEKVEWTIKTKFLPIWEGDVIELVIPGGDAYSGSRKCLVKSIDIKGPYLDMDLTLKEVTNVDSED